MATEVANKRRYRKRLRAAQEAATRQRITEAAVRLHGTIGPAGANVSAVAEEAGVQRATVYRHFPDDEALFKACTAHWDQLNPRPDPESWRAVRDPEARLLLALEELYGWYERVGGMLYLTMIRDAELVPDEIRRRGMAYADAVRDALMQGRRARGRKRERIAAAIGHATSFPAWLSLAAQQGLRREDAVAVMSAMVEGASR